MKTLCEICRETFAREELTEFDGELLCPACLATHTTICGHCGERIWVNDIYGPTDAPLCERCFDNHYTTCEHCGRIIPSNEALYEDDEPYCERCYNRNISSSSIRDYYYKPDPLFYGRGPRYFGVELEVDGAGERNDYARQVMEIANMNGTHLYCKHDGSLDEGFELVTHPMSLTHHCQNMPWAKILNRLKELGYRSHQTNTCGLHCHISRKAFGETKEAQDAAIARVLYFVEKHWEELLKFSRRTQRQLERWANRYGYQSDPKKLYDDAVKNYGAGRYTCVNLTNSQTIEFRIFRGTLKLNTLIATLQMIDRICDVALYLSDDDLQNLSWTTFVSGCTQPELVQYLKERRLYVNDYVTTEEEL